MCVIQPDRGFTRAGPAMGGGDSGGIAKERPAGLGRRSVPGDVRSASALPSDGQVQGASGSRSAGRAWPTEPGSFGPYQAVLYLGTLGNAFLFLGERERVCVCVGSGGGDIEMGG